MIVEGKTFELPSEGVHEAAIVQIKDLGIVNSPKYGDKRKVQFKYECLDEQGSDGKPRSAIESFNATLGSGSRLGERVTSLIGRHPGSRYDLSGLKGWRGQIVIQHTDSNGRTYANVTGVIRRKGDQ
jgi:hypothetical protein